MTREALLAHEFPNLCHLIITSPDTFDYNCIAWAAGRNDVWMWPDEDSYWPAGVVRAETRAAFVEMFAALGYTQTLSADLEPGLEKIALYEKSGMPTHAARQLPNGNWTSKCGPAEDIEHDFAGLVGEKWYGEIALLMARPRSA